MRIPARSGPIRSLAIALALVGAMMFGAPRNAQAAPAIVTTQVAGPASALTEVQYGGHWRRHHHHRHFGHHHHRRFGHHHHRRHFGHRFGHHRHHHHGHRRYRY